MQTAQDLLEAAKVAIADEEYGDVVDILEEIVLSHVDATYSLGRKFEKWDWSEVKMLCHKIGNMLYKAGGLKLMKEVYEDFSGTLHAKQALSNFWQGCGNGAWV